MKSDVKEPNASGVGSKELLAPLTVKEMLKCIPEEWREAQITVGGSIGTAEAVERIALHQDVSGRRVVVIYTEELDVRG